MTIRKIKKYGTKKSKYFGRIAGEVVAVVFDANVAPIEGDIQVMDGRMISKNLYNYFIVNKYREA